MNKKIDYLNQVFQLFQENSYIFTIDEIISNINILLSYGLSEL